MKTLSLEQMENVEGGKFFGRSTKCDDSSGNGNYVCHTYFSALWFTWETNNTFLVSNCDYCNVDAY